jgi:phage FluMu gp28-like protein
MVALLPQAVIKRKLESSLELWFVNGSHLQFRTLENPDNLRGFGIDFLVVDEAEFMLKDVWEQILRPTLADRKGRGLFTGTPKGKNYYYELFTRGQDDMFPDYESFTFPTSSNPYIDAGEIETARRELPSSSFRQEYLAEFLDDGAGVFRGIRRCIAGKLLDAPIRGERYYIGVDLGKHVDFTVLCVFDKRRQLVGFERYNQIEWPFQKARITETARKWNNASVLIDSTGVGDPMFDELRRAGLNIQGYQFTNETKKNLIEALSVDIEQGRISYPDIPVLLNELEIFGYEITKAGNVRYNAPEGYHDDCVIALALGNWLIRTPPVLQRDVVHVGGF